MNGLLLISSFIIFVLGLDVDLKIHFGQKDKLNLQTKGKRTIVAVKTNTKRHTAGLLWTLKHPKELKVIVDERISELKMGKADHHGYQVLNRTKQVSRRLYRLVKHCLLGTAVFEINDVPLPLRQTMQNLPPALRLLVAWSVRSFDPVQLGNMIPDNPSEGLVNSGNYKEKHGKMMDTLNVTFDGGRLLIAIFMRSQGNLPLIQ
jgi:hypothetical protein